MLLNKSAAIVTLFPSKWHKSARQCLRLVYLRLLYSRWLTHWLCTVFSFLCRVVKSTTCRYQVTPYGLVLKPQRDIAYDVVAFWGENKVSLLNNRNGTRSCQEVPG